MATTIFLVNPVNFGGASFTNDYSLLFDGVDEWLNCGTVSELSNVSNFSASFWIKTSSVSDTVLFARKTSSTVKVQLVLSSAGFLQMFVNDSDSSWVKTDNSILSAGWNHVSIVYDGGGATNADKIKIYVNGTNNYNSTSGTVKTTTPTFTTQKLGIASDGTPAAYTSCYIDEFAIFDYSLTSGQVTSIYNSGTPTDLDNTSGVTAPVHWWRMGDGDTFPTITDVGTTGGNNGTMTNMESGDIVTDTP